MSAQLGTDWELHTMLRVANGRPAVRTRYQHYDPRTRRVSYSVTRDPILDLAVARQWRRPGYGALRVLVMKPVGLP